MSRLRGVVALLAMMFVSVSMFAAAVVENVVPAAGSVWYGNVQLWEIVGTIVIALWGILKAKYALDETLSIQVTEFIEMGAQKTYDEYIRDLKAEGGKLTAVQIKEAQTRTWESAKDVARDKGLDLARKVAADRLPSLISAIVKRMKR